ncbi:MAG: hypothetical protein O7C75_16175, partial [Verrucomicrobia bacterium]|nr:hypothetical protein [Verrucomicrobiota bacterium]
MTPTKLKQINQPASRKELDSSFAQSYPYKILVVEDNVINAKVLVTILKRLGYEPEVACNGEECLTV